MVSRPTQKIDIENIFIDQIPKVLSDSLCGISVISVLVFKPSTSRQSLGISLTKVFDSLSREGPDVDNEITSPTLPA